MIYNVKRIRLVLAHCVFKVSHNQMEKKQLQKIIYEARVYGMRGNCQINNFIVQFCQQ